MLPDHQAICFLGLSSAGWITLALVLVSASMVIVGSRRLSVLALLLQYTLLGLLVSPELYRPIMLVRFALGFAICLILYITAGHAEAEPMKRPSRSARGSVFGSLLGPASGSADRAGMGTVFRVLALILGALAAYGTWRAYPLPSVPAGHNLITYWLVSMGLIQLLIGVDPLRVGVGLLTVTSGLQTIYLSFERGLLVTGLIGIVDVLMALAIAYSAEVWLESLRAEAAGQ